MRIVSGSHRKRRIATPDGRNTRPTSDQTRESVFNILEHAEWALPLDGAHVMDIFAGSGALGLEAISRGADYCLFVERDPKALTAIRKNIDHFGLSADQARLHRFDATKLKVAPGNRPAPFTHVFMDPPYKKGLWQPTLRRLPPYLADGAVIMLEEGIEAEIDVTVLKKQGWSVKADKIWGAARVLFLVRE